MTLREVDSPLRSAVLPRQPPTHPIDPCEVEAVALAEELRADKLLIDDRLGRGLPLHPCADGGEFAEALDGFAGGPCERARSSTAVSAVGPIPTGRDPARCSSRRDAYWPHKRDACATSRCSRVPTFNHTQGASHDSSRSGFSPCVRNRITTPSARRWSRVR